MSTINDKPPATQASDGLCSRGSERKKAARKRAKRTPIATENNDAVDPAKQLRPRTDEEIANEQTAEQLALRIWAAMVAQKVLSSMSVLMDELIQSHLLDDDDEEGDEGWLDDHRKRKKTILDEAIVDALDKYPDFNTINNLPRNPVPDIARDAEQLKDALTKCPIGATEFKVKFPPRNLSGWSSAISRRNSRRMRSTARTCARMCRDRTSRHTAAGAAPRRRGRSPKLPIRERRRVGRAVHGRLDASRQGSHRPGGLVASVWAPAENRGPELAPSLRDHGAKWTSEQLPTPPGKASGDRPTRHSLADESGRPRCWA